MPDKKMTDKNKQAFKSDYIWNGVQEDCEGWQCITYYDCLKDWAKAYGARPAAVFDEETVTYEELLTKSRALAGFLQQEGLQKGDHVIMQLPAGIVFLITLFACFEIGLLPVMALPAHGTYELSALAETTEAKAFFCQNTFLNPDAEQNARLIKEQVPYVGKIYNEAVLREGILTGALFDERDLPCWQDIALLLLSGGTTGIPKLIPRTHGDYIYDNLCNAGRCEVGSDDVFLVVLPGQHNFALGNPGILGTLMVGGKVVFSGSPSPMEVAELIEAEGITYTAMVPALVEQLLRYREAFPEEDLSTLRFLMVGGAPLLPSVAAKIEPVLGCRLLQIYGTAEGLNCCFPPSADTKVRLALQGPPISPYDEMRIVDENDRELPFGEAGELLTRGPYTIRGYYRNPTANRTSFTADGWYRTGDKAVMNERYEILIVGRVKEQINRAGEKISPAELEELLLGCSQVTDCAIAGVPDEMYGTAVAAFVVPGENVPDKETLNQFLLSRGAASFKQLDHLVLVDAIPLTAVGKTDKKLLIQEWQDDR